MGNIGRGIRHQLVRFLSFCRVRYFRMMGITIGKNCFISWGAHLDTRRGNIIIGRNVNIAHGTYILSHIGYRPQTEVIETVIEDNVKIFVNSIVLPGVRIGENSVVGAGAVVMKDVPPDVVVMGNPARVTQHLGNDQDHKNEQTA
jgi:acetyltransferase-like isoleucine patch superfamily enzyme